MRLSELVGNHVLQGVDRLVLIRKNIFGEKEDVNAIAFQLDGKTYLAAEDPNDGYRSYCEDIVVYNTPSKFRIPDVPVVCSMMEPEVYSDVFSFENDVLVIRDAVNGKKVLCVGTMHVDDYYPYCYFDYRPENLSCNIESPNDSPEQKHIRERDFLEELKPILAVAVGSDYAGYLASDDDFFSAVIEDVEATSAWQEEGYYTDDDIRLAIGRTLMAKYGIEY